MAKHENRRCSDNNLNKNLISACGFYCGYCGINLATQENETKKLLQYALRIYNYVRLVRNGSSTGVNENKDNHKFNIYPNPVSDELTMEMRGDREKASFELLNSIGQTLQNGSFIEKTVIQTNTFATGVYLIKLQYGNTFEVKKLIKE